MARSKSRTKTEEDLVAYMESAKLYTVSSKIIVLQAFLHSHPPFCLPSSPLLSQIFQLDNRPKISDGAPSECFMSAEACLHGHLYVLARHGAEGLEAETGVCIMTNPVTGIGKICRNLRRIEPLFHDKSGRCNAWQRNIISAEIRDHSSSTA